MNGNGKLTETENVFFT